VPTNFHTVISGEINICQLASLCGESCVCESFKKTILGFVLLLLSYAVFNLWSMFHNCAAASFSIYPYIQYIFYCLYKDNDAWTGNILIPHMTAEVMRCAVSAMHFFQWYVNAY